MKIKEKQKLAREWFSTLQNIICKNTELLEKKYSNFKFKPKDTLLFGRESEGVPKIVHDNSYERLKIPLKKNTRSLNISMAVAITLSEALKQNNFFQND